MRIAERGMLMKSNPDPVAATCLSDIVRRTASAVYRNGTTSDPIAPAIPNRPQNASEITLHQHSVFRSPQSAFSHPPIADSSSPKSAHRLLICHVFFGSAEPKFWAFSLSRCDSDKNFIQMFDFFTIFARQIIPSLGTPYDALHN